MTRKKQPEPVDVVIVGAGAGGATAAKVLSEAGLKVVGLERGPWLKPEHASGDELKFLNRNFIWQDPKLKPRTYRPNDTVRGGDHQLLATPQVVGGGTTHWGGMVPRMAESDFKLRSLHGDVPGASLVDWPISYDELEPYYTRVEWEFGTSGLAGANKWEAWRSRGYPTKPSPLSQIGRTFATAMSQARPQHASRMPQGMVTEPYRGRQPFSENGFWQQYPDPGNGKSSTLISFIPDAIATGRYDLRSDSYVSEILVGKDGRATGVRYQDEDGDEFVQHAKAVIVCGGGIETPRLLLMSKSALFPDGLGNGSGMVGQERDVPPVLVLGRPVRPGGQRPAVRVGGPLHEPVLVRLLRDRREPRPHPRLADLPVDDRAPGQLELPGPPDLGPGGQGRRPRVLQPQHEDRRPAARSAGRVQPRRPRPERQGRMGPAGRPHHPHAALQRLRPGEAGRSPRTERSSRRPARRRSSRSTWSASRATPRTNWAPPAWATTRQRPSSTAGAARTRYRTSTSSTRASSRPRPASTRP